MKWYAFDPSKPNGAPEKGYYLTYHEKFGVEYFFYNPEDQFWWGVECDDEIGPPLSPQYWAYLPEFDPKDIVIE